MAERKIKVVFIDDDPTQIEFFKFIMRTSNYETYYFTSGKESLNFLENNSVDIVFIDIIMPDITGDVIINKIKNNFIIFIVISGLVDVLSLKDKLDLNRIYAYFEKPVKKDDIYNVLDEIKLLFYKDMNLTKLEDLKRKCEEIKNKINF